MVAAAAHWTTKALAGTVNISVQQVRNYERDGFIPPVPRDANGYRRYGRVHMIALQTTRQLVVGYGWKETRAILGAVHQGDLSAALALIDAQHAALHQARRQVEQTLAAQSLTTETGWRRVLLRVGAAAQMVGVRVSALRFWEQQGLLYPTRDPESGYRLYDEQQLRRLRVVVLLRDAGYGFEAIHATLNEMAAGAPEKAIVAAERKQAELARKSRECLAALALLNNYLREFYMELYEGL